MSGRSEDRIAPSKLAVPEERGQGDRVGRNRRYPFGFEGAHPAAAGHLRLGFRQ